MDIYAALTGETTDQVMAQHAGAGWGQFKPALAEVAVEVMGPITGEMNRLMSDPAEIDRLLARGAERAREIAAPIVKETRQIMGMVG